VPTDLETPCASCDHASAAHEHCRPGTDCGLCDCARFRRFPGVGAVL